MSFFDSYKRLDNLCKDLFQTDRGISSYIEEMEKHRYVNYPIEHWDSDYKNLKHLRYCRNQIAHVDGVTEEEICTEDDIRWLEDFYQRILNQTDPIAKYYQMDKSNSAESKRKQYTAYYEYDSNRSTDNMRIINNVNNMSSPDQQQTNYTLIVTVGIIVGLAFIIALIAIGLACTL